MDLIDRQAAIDAIEEMQMPIMRSVFTEEQLVFTGMSEALNAIKRLSSAQPEIIRCKDCKHKPTTTPDYNADDGDCGFEIEFPDYRCPCQCDDGWYNRLPEDDWFCGNAERRENDG